MNEDLMYYVIFIFFVYFINVFNIILYINVLGRGLLFELNKGIVFLMVNLYILEEVLIIKFMVNLM